MGSMSIGAISSAGNCAVASGLIRRRCSGLAISMRACARAEIVSASQGMRAPPPERYTAASPRPSEESTERKASARSIPIASSSLRSVSSGENSSARPECPWMIDSASSCERPCMRRSSSPMWREPKATSRVTVGTPSCWMRMFEISCPTFTSATTPRAASG